MGGIESCGDSALRALKLRKRVIAVAHLRCYRACVRCGARWCCLRFCWVRATDATTSATQNSADLGEAGRLVDGRQGGMWSIGCRFHALLRRDVGWEANALSTRPGPKTTDLSVTCCRSNRGSHSIVRRQPSHRHRRNSYRSGHVKRCLIVRAGIAMSAQDWPPGTCMRETVSVRSTPATTRAVPC